MKDLQLAGVDSESKLYRQWRRFHAANPDVWAEFKRFTFQAINAGRDRFSARMVVHRIRWESLIATTGEDGWKINNNHSPYYARLFMQTYPQHAGIFETREAPTCRTS